MVSTASNTSTEQEEVVVSSPHTSAQGHHQTPAPFHPSPH